MSWKIKKSSYERLGRDGNAGRTEGCPWSSETSVLMSTWLTSLFGVNNAEDCGISTDLRFLSCCLPLYERAEFKNISSSTVSASRAARLAKIVFPLA